MTKAHFMPPMYAPDSPEEINRAQREGRPEPRSAEQPDHDDNLNYERYMDGLRRSNARMLNTLLSLEAEITSAIDGSEECRGRDAQLSAWAYKAGRAISQASPRVATNTAAKTITVSIEGGLVQDVTGIPAGYELRIEDHDGDDTSHPAWDAQKGCFVAVYDGGAHA